MHELSIAMSIVDIAIEQAEQLGARVVSVRLLLGPLSGIVKEPLLAAWPLAAEGTPLENAHLLIEEVPVVAWCPTCRRKQHIESIQLLRCPFCETATPEVLTGRELLVTALEVVDDPRNQDSPGQTAGAQAK
jgi:hydrogenase nickel incorporation protein HypA/HybF